jgi:hypothetical protein
MTKTLELLDNATRGAGLFLLVDHERKVWIVSRSMVPSPERIKRNGSWSTHDLGGDEFTDGAAARAHFTALLAARKGVLS